MVSAIVFAAIMIHVQAHDAAPLFHVLNLTPAKNFFGSYRGENAGRVYHQSMLLLFHFVAGENFGLHCR
jgi:hypothetical protein